MEAGEDLPTLAAETQQQHGEQKHRKQRQQDQPPGPPPGRPGADMEGGPGCGLPQVGHQPVAARGADGVGHRQYQQPGIPLPDQHGPTPEATHLRQLVQRPVRRVVRAFQVQVVGIEDGPGKAANRPGQLPGQQGRLHPDGDERNSQVGQGVKPPGGRQALERAAPGGRQGDAQKDQPQHHPAGPEQPPPGQVPGGEQGGQNGLPAGAPLPGQVPRGQPEQGRLPGGWWGLRGECAGSGCLRLRCADVLLHTDASL